MAREWIFCVNTFDANTRYNFKKMLTLTLDHYGKLVYAANVEPLFIPIRDSYQPLHITYQNSYAAWKAAEGIHEGSTGTVEGMLTQLNSEVRSWEGTVRYVFPEDSPNERASFPNKRAPFQKGTYEQRISAILTLSEVLATFTTQPLLVTLSTTVLTFYNTIEAVRILQTGGEIGITSKSAGVEADRKACATAMYGNLGLIMHILRETPTEIEQFWDMSLLRNITDNTYTESLTIDPNSIATAGLTEQEREAVTASTIVFIKNTSAAGVNLKVGFAATAGVTPTTIIELVPAEERELSASELGWSSDKKYLVINNTETETGTLDLEVQL